MERIVPWLVPALWAAWAIVWVAMASRAGRGRRMDSIMARVAHFSTLGLGFALVTLPALSIGPLAWRFLPVHWIVLAAGTAIVAAGLSFAVWARVHLGRYWSGAVRFVDGHRLIRTGPYAIVRHPIYAGIGAAILGTAVAVGEVRALLAFLLIAAAYLHRIRIEERLLAREFGAEHDRYRRDVKALVPFLL